MKMKILIVLPLILCVGILMGHLMQVLASAPSPVGHTASQTGGDTDAERTFYSNGKYIFQLDLQINRNLNVGGSITRNGNTVWDAGNDGSSSSLDADLLDGQHGSYYLDTSSSTQTKQGSLTVAGELHVGTSTGVWVQPIALGGGASDGGNRYEHTSSTSNVKYAVLNTLPFGVKAKFWADLAGETNAKNTITPGNFIERICSGATADLALYQWNHLTDTITRLSTVASVSVPSKGCCNDSPARQTCRVISGEVTIPAIGKTSNCHDVGLPHESCDFKYLVVEYRSSNGNTVDISGAGLILYG